MARRRTHVLGGGIVLASLIIAWFAGAFDHATEFRQISNSRQETIACMQSELIKGDGIRCGELAGINIPDFANGYVYARRVGASFIRYFPMLPTPTAAGMPQLLLRFPDATAPPPKLFNLAALPAHGGVSRFTALDNAMMQFETGNQELMGRCIHFQFEALIATGSVDTSSLRFRTTKASEYAKARMTSAEAVPGDSGTGTRRLTFDIEATDGLLDELQFFPVPTPQDFAIHTIMGRCRLARARS
jgi:hypothetical protein